MEITKKEFVQQLFNAQRISLLYGGYVSEDVFFNNLDKLLAFKGVFDRKVIKANNYQITFRWDDGTCSVLDYFQQNDGRKHYQFGDVLIRQELHNNYKPNFVAYRISEIN